MRRKYSQLDFDSLFGVCIVNKCSNFHSIFSWTNESKEQQWETVIEVLQFTLQIWTEKFKWFRRILIKILLKFRPIVTENESKNGFKKVFQGLALWTKNYISSKDKPKRWKCMGNWAVWGGGYRLTDSTAELMDDQLFTSSISITFLIFKLFS